MPVSKHAIVAVLIGAVWAGPAGAQTTAAPQQPAPIPTSPNYGGRTDSHWLASGFVGTSFGLDTSDASIDVGGQLAYLWRGVFGGELLASYSPGFEVGHLFLADDPTVFSYMANLIAALPLGADTTVQPYVSGGVGGIQMKTTIFNAFIPSVNPLEDGLIAGGVTDGERTRLAWNLGAGLLGFVGNVGFRGDIRYFKASSDDDPDAVVPADALTQTILSGIEFWRANVGIAFRW
jgi:opacity protein-like surface antigen